MAAKKADASRRSYAPKIGLLRERDVSALDQVEQGVVVQQVLASRIDADTIKGTTPGKPTANGKVVSEESASSATVSVPLDHYDGLTTRLGQLEAENTQYRKMLVAHEDETSSYQDEVKQLKEQLEYYRQPFWRRWRKRKAENESEE